MPLRLFPLLLFLVLVPFHGRAQQQSPSVQRNDQQLRQEFADGFLLGCVAGKTPSISNQQRYCTCLVNAYIKRYDGRTLALITQLAADGGPSIPVLADVMMTPERQACAARRQ